MCVAQDYPNEFLKRKAGFQGTIQETLISRVI